MQYLAFSYDYAQHITHEDEIWIVKWSTLNKLRDKLTGWLWWSRVGVCCAYVLFAISCMIQSDGYWSFSLSPLFEIKLWYRRKRWNFFPISYIFFSRTVGKAQTRIKNVHFARLLSLYIIYPSNCEAKASTSHANKSKMLKISIACTVEPRLSDTRLTDTSVNRHSWLQSYRFFYINVLIWIYWEKKYCYD